jgi:hypothetical protein
MKIQAMEPGFLAGKIFGAGNVVQGVAERNKLPEGVDGVVAECIILTGSYHRTNIGNRPKGNR